MHFVILSKTFVAALLKMTSAKIFVTDYIIVSLDLNIGPAVQRINITGFDGLVKKLFHCFFI